MLSYLACKYICHQDITSSPSWRTCGIFSGKVAICLVHSMTLFTLKSSPLSLLSSSTILSFEPCFRPPLHPMFCLHHLFLPLYLSFLFFLMSFIFTLMCRDEMSYCWVSTFLRASEECVRVCQDHHWRLWTLIGMEWWKTWKKKGLWKAFGLY